MKNNFSKIFIITGAGLLSSSAAWAQTAATTQADPNFYSRFLANGLMVFTGLVLLGAVLALFQLLNMMIKVQQIKIYQEQGFEAYQEAVEKPRIDYWNKFMSRWTKVVPLEKEEDILFDHNYDGIRELDNSLPPWWVAMFYLTILFAGVYLVYYHVADIGLGSREAYEVEMADAQKAVDAYLATQSNLVDETTVVRLTDDTDLSVGAAVFNTNCVVCHGALGEGGIGPNFTDDYWIHGGTIQDIFKTIKYGVPEKGMIAWKSQLSAGDMAKVASYIMTLHGTNPPNQKDPEGTLFTPETTTPSDTTAAAGGSIGMINQ